MRPLRLLGRFREEVLYREEELLDEEEGRVEEAVVVEAKEVPRYFWRTRKKKKHVTKN